MFSVSTDATKPSRASMLLFAEASATPTAGALHCRWPCPAGGPADPDAIAAARTFLASCSGRVVVASHNDVDGLSALVVVMRALAGPGVSITPLPASRGEHVHQDALRIASGRSTPTV